LKSQYFTGIYAITQFRIYIFSRIITGRRGLDRMVVGFITTYAISSDHH